MKRPFNSIYTHGFARVAVCIPPVQLSDPAVNAERTIQLAKRAADRQAVLAVFPELGLSAYSNDDLFHQDALLEATEQALAGVVSASCGLAPLLLVGAALRWEQKLLNCAVAVHRGRLLGVVPKSYLPNYREFYEKRQFTSGFACLSREMRLLDQQVPLGNDLVFTAGDLPDLAVHAEICEDLWTPLPPSTFAALAGATVLANLSASNITVGKAGYRRELCAMQSAKCLAAYLYVAAGPGESTTDLAWDGHGLIYENDQLLAESERFCDQPQCVIADVDLERLRQERMRLTSFQDTVERHRGRLSQLRRIEFQMGVPEGDVPLERVVDRFPYVPDDPAKRDERCSETYNIQVTALAQRLRATGVQKLVIGVSGGLDSTQALLVACRCMDRLGLPRSNVLGYTMPGFATSQRTLESARQLMASLEVTASEIDIRAACEGVLRDLGHPFADGQSVFDVTFENVQAGERTSRLFRLANFHQALVLGTGDLSELALGWTTYGVGDQMSHYNVNASVPKTLIQHLIRWVIDGKQFAAAANDVLQKIVDTEISPELVPNHDGAASEQPQQRTQEVIGPYELQDFHLYYVSRFGFRPSKIAFLAQRGWSDSQLGWWPSGHPHDGRTEYQLADIKRWLAVFLRRFFQSSQFKRSAMPNAPKVGSGGSLSPRGDWRAPSDSTATTWLQELQENVPD